ncbi:MAG: restriction endonuclease subunit S [Paludibacteraceae bacterium]|nr:restriction endonuclease subunit S [Paludibacteraceae bacterium]
MPFEIPEGWCWRTLGDIGIWQAGGTPSRMHKEYYGGNIPWLKTGDLNDGIITSIPEYITEEGLNNSSAKLNPKGSVLIAMYGATIGKIGILGMPATTNQACCACINYEGVIQKYLFYFLLSHKEDFIALGGGGAQPNISKDIIVKTFIPIPPIKEQERIVSQIDNLLNLLGTLDTNKYALEASISQAKSKILDLAIHGKLVPQDANDEPASDLLRRINPKAVASCDNPQYGKVPSNWVWCKIEDIFNVIMGQSPKGDSVNHELIGIEFHQGKILFSQCVVEKSDIYTTSPTKIADKDSLLVCVRAPVGDVNITDRDICIGRGLCALKPLSNMPLEYWFYAIKNLKLEFNKKATGSTFLAISAVTIKSQAISLPPIEEQHRIVAKVKELFSQLDMIEKSLQA